MSDVKFFDAHLHTSHVREFPGREGCFYLSCAAGPRDWPLLRKESRREIRIFLGIHPMTIPEDPPGTAALLEELETLLPACPDAGIGECGLDRRYYKSISRHRQEEVLRFQIRLAVRLGRPLSFHQVKAAGALAEVLEDEKPEVPFLIHGFKEKRETAARYIRRGAMLSLGPGRQWEDSGFRNMVRTLPRDRLLLESDWPYTDSPYEKTIIDLYDRAAGVLGIDRAGLLDIVNTNGKVFTN